MKRSEGLGDCLLFSRSRPTRSFELIEVTSGSSHLEGMKFVSTRPHTSLDIFRLTLRDQDTE